MKENITGPVRMLSILPRVVQFGVRSKVWVRKLSRIITNP